MMRSEIQISILKQSIAESYDSGVRPIIRGSWVQFDSTNGPDGDSFEFDGVEYRPAHLYEIFKVVDIRAAGTLDGVSVIMGSDVYAFNYNVSIIGDPADAREILKGITV